MANNALSRELSLALLTSKDMKGKYGENPNAWRAAGAATLIGGEISEGIAKHGNLMRKIENAENQRQELAARAEISIQGILDTGKKVEALQKTAFIKSGVKLEGSALNVIAETAEQAVNAAKARQRETDFEQGQLSLANALRKVKAKGQTTETLLNVASTGVSAFAGAGG